MAKRRPYRTEWVEDLPERVAKDTVYIVGGERHPFRAAVVCPRHRCQQVIHLDIAPSFARRWSMTVHSDKTLSLHPSIHVTGHPCRCHYWLRRGKIRWSEAPGILVPRENTRDPDP